MLVFVKYVFDKKVKTTKKERKERKKEKIMSEGIKKDVENIRDKKNGNHQVKWSI